MCRASSFAKVETYIMPTIKTRLFVLPPDRDVAPTYLEVDWPERFHGFPGKPLPVDYPPRYQAIARFPGVLDTDEISARAGTDLEALLLVLASVRQFWKEFEKAGGKIYGSMANDESVPDLSCQVKIKDFFWL